MTRDWGAHLTDVVLPWWEAHGVDDAHGGVRTGFDNAGRLHTDDRFTWSQGRWAWLAGELADEARAGRLAVDAERWSRRCVATCERLVREALRDDGRTHFRTTDGGTPVATSDGETATSVFADLFAVLGLSAGLRQLGGDDPRAAAWAAHATHVLGTAAAAIADRTALSEPYPVPAGFTDLAGPMTLLHTAAELVRAPLPGQASDTARRVRDDAAAALTGRILGADDWWEMRPDDPADADTLVARHRTPGHLLELLWMIDHAQADDPAFHPVPAARLHRLATRAIELGWDADHGGVLRYADRDGGRPTGRPLDVAYERLVVATWSTKLWWVHVEAAYALTRFGAQGDRDLADWAERVTRYTLDTFPDPGGQEWIQIRGRDGTPLDEVVALPVKDPFHVIRALVLLNRLTPREAT